jgi:hypothetical protein
MARIKDISRFGGMRRFGCGEQGVWEWGVVRMTVLIRRPGRHTEARASMSATGPCPCGGTRRSSVEAAGMWAGCRGGRTTASRGSGRPAEGGTRRWPECLLRVDPGVTRQQGNLRRAALGALQGSQEPGELFASPNKPARDSYGHARKYEVGRTDGKSASYRRSMEALVGAATPPYL